MEILPAFCTADLRKRCIVEQKSLSRSILQYTGIKVPGKQLVHALYFSACYAKDKDDLDRRIDEARDMLLERFEKRQNN